MEGADFYFGKSIFRVVIGSTNQKLNLDVGAIDISKEEQDGQCYGEPNKDVIQGES